MDDLLPYPPNILPLKEQEIKTTCRLELSYLKKQNSGQCMTTFHETIYMRYHILSHQNLTYKIGNATHKKFLY